MTNIYTNYTTYPAVKIKKYDIIPAEVELFEGKAV